MTPTEIFQEHRDRNGGESVITIASYMAMVVNMLQSLHDEIQELKNGPPPIVGHVGSVVTDDRVPGTLDGVYKGAGK